MPVFLQIISSIYAYGFRLADGKRRREDYGR